MFDIIPVAEEWLQTEPNESKAATIVQELLSLIEYLKAENANLEEVLREGI